jgi:hypothetical protein
MVAETFSRRFKNTFRENVEFFHDVYRGSWFSFFTNHGFGYNKKNSALQSAFEAMVKSKNKKRDRNIADTSNDDDTKRPDLKDLQSAISQSFKYKGRNTGNLPIIVFIRKWNGKLEKGWARVLVSGSRLLSPKSKNQLSEHERNIVGYIGAIISATRHPACVDAVAFAFGTVGNTVRNAMEQHCEDLFSARLKDTHCVTISDPPHLAPQLLQTPSQEVKRT